tara:strand:+ start:540 stop:1043 length:504 start_codon:yes stop_codon:yes gene_type:complete
MKITIKKYYKSFLIIIFLTISCFLFYVYENKSRKNNKSHTSSEPIVLNLLTGVHPSLSWSFKPVKSKIIVNPGEITSIEYVVENLSNKTTSGIATFSYYPKQLGAFISKLNCFCYDAQTLKPKQKDTYNIVLLIDPKVTKDNKTKNIKEATIQFIFFDYKKFKDNKI